MRDTSQGPGWSEASDESWYAPELPDDVSSAPAKRPAHQAATSARDGSASNPSMPPGWWQDENGTWHLPERATAGTPRHAAADPHKEPNAPSTPAPANPSMPPGWWQDESGTWHLPERATAGVPRHAAADPDVVSTLTVADDGTPPESELRSPPGSMPLWRRRAVVLGLPSLLVALIALAILLATTGEGTSSHLSSDPSEPSSGRTHSGRVQDDHTNDDCAHDDYTHDVCAYDDYATDSRTEHHWQHR